MLNRRRGITPIDTAIGFLVFCGLSLLVYLIISTNRLPVEKVYSGEIATVVEIIDSSNPKFGTITVETESGEHRAYHDTANHMAVGDEVRIYTISGPSKIIRFDESKPPGNQIVIEELSPTKEKTWVSAHKVVNDPADCQS